MNTLVDQVTMLTGRLVPASGSDMGTLAQLRALIAAILIQRDPALLPIVPSINDDPVMVEAARQGEVLAADRKAIGVRSRFERADYLTADNAATRIAQTFGPFIDGEGVLASSVSSTWRRC